MVGRARALVLDVALLTCDDLIIGLDKVGGISSYHEKLNTSLAHCRVKRLVHLVGIEIQAALWLAEAAFPGWVSVMGGGNR